MDRFIFGRRSPFYFFFFLMKTIWAIRRFEHRNFSASFSFPKCAAIQINLLIKLKLFFSTSLVHMVTWLTSCNGYFFWRKQNDKFFKKDNNIDFTRSNKNLIRVSILIRERKRKKQIKTIASTIWSSIEYRTLFLSESHELC